MIIPLKKLPKLIRILLMPDGLATCWRGNGAFKSGLKYNIEKVFSTHRVFTLEGVREIPCYKMKVLNSKFSLKEFAAHFVVPEVPSLKEKYPDIHRQNRFYAEKVFEYAGLEKFEYQLDDLGSLLMLDCAILDYEQGMGKSLTGLVWARCKKILNPDIRRTLVITPQDLIEQWQGEAERIGWKLTELPKNGSLEDGNYITYYENLKECADKYKDSFQLIIPDEAHKIKSRKAARAKAMRKLNAKYKLTLTATPIKNIVKDLHYLVGWTMGYGTSIFPYLETEQHKFRKDFGVYEISDGHKKLVPQVGNMEELKLRLSPFLLQRNMDETGIKLVNKKIYRIGISFTEEQYAEYRRVLNSDMQDTKKHWELRKICNLYPGNKKLEMIEKITQSVLNRNEQVVMFTGLVAAADKYKSMYGRRSEIANGTISPVQRGHVISRFKKGLYPILIGGLEAVNAGHSMQNANNMIVTDFPWTASTLDHALKRVFRINSKKDVNVYLLYIKNSVDEEMIELIDAKQEPSVELLDANDFLKNVVRVE